MSREGTRRKRRRCRIHRVEVLSRNQSIHLTRLCTECIAGKCLTPDGQKVAVRAVRPSIQVPSVPRGARPRAVAAPPRAPPHREGPSRRLRGSPSSGSSLCGRRGRSCVVHRPFDDGSAAPRQPCSRKVPGRGPLPSREEKLMGARPRAPSSTGAETPRGPRICVPEFAGASTRFGSPCCVEEL